MANLDKQDVPYISKLLISQIPPITQEVELHFSREVNIFIGPNSTGKTTILKLLKSKGPGRESDSDQNQLYPLFSFMTIPRGKLEVNVSDQEQAVESIDKMPLVWIPAIRAPLGMKEYNLLGENQVDVNNLTRLRRLDDMTDPIDLFSANAVARIINAYYEGNNVELIDRAFTVAEKAFLCVKDICVKPGLFTGDTVNYYIHRGFVRRPRQTETGPRFVDVPEIYNLMGFNVIDDPNRNVYAGDLSSGPQGLYVWILYMAFRLAHFYDFQDEWYKKSGVLLIDEIENHLHPNWQRRVIDALREHFPNVQIFATTHSPFLVSGRQAGEVYVCGRDQEHRVYVDPIKDSVFSWSADEILSEFMDVDYPTDSSTEQAIKIVNWLEEQDPLPQNISAQEWRETQIARLKDEMNSEEALDSEKIVLQWLEGSIKHLIALPEELEEQNSEEWRLKVIEQFIDITGTNIFEGGPLAAHRRFLEGIPDQSDEDNLKD